MEQQQQQQPPPSEQSQPPSPAQPPPPAPSPTPPSSSASTTSAAAAPSIPPPSTSASSALNPSTSPQTPQSRPAASSFQHLAPPPRGGLAIGVPAQAQAQPPASFSSLASPSFAHQFPASTSLQGRQPVQGMQGIGITGSLGSSMPMRPAGAPAQPVRSITTSLRQQSVANSQPSPTQNFQGHGMLRSPNPPTPQSQNQAWLSSGAQGKPPLPSALRPQLTPQSLQQRSHIRPQHQHSVSTSQQQQYTSSAQQVQPSVISQSQENVGQQIQSPRVQQPFPTQQATTRSHGVGVQRPPSHAVLHSSTAQPGPLSKTGSEETEEPCNRILSKRSIQELVTQIDPSEKLDPEVEDILVDIADEFVESLTTFGCSLAKHRKSSTLEAKDILLHAEKYWNITLPGFTGDDIRTYKKPVTTDIHRERLAAIKRSYLTVKTTTSKSTGGQGGNSKTHFGKGSGNVLTSPNAKT